MPLIAQELDRYSQVVKMEFAPEVSFCRESVVVNEASTRVLAVGTVLGLVTATGKYKVSVQNAADGSQNAAAVVLEDATAAAGVDTRVLAMVNGPALLSKSALKFDASYDLPAELTTAYAALAAKQIKVNDTI